MCMCILRYPAPYCHLWPARLYNIFFKLSLKEHNFRKKKLLNIKCVFLFSLQRASETSLIIGRNKGQIIKNVKDKDNWYFTRYPFPILTLRRLMSYIYIYMEHPFLMFLDHTQRRSTVGRTPLDE